jgi:hypothetical protein
MIREISFEDVGCKNVVTRRGGRDFAGGLFGCFRPLFSFFTRGVSRRRRHTSGELGGVAAAALFGPEELLSFFGTADVHPTLGFAYTKTL